MSLTPRHKLFSSDVHKPNLFLMDIKGNIQIHQTLKAVMCIQVWVLVMIPMLNILTPHLLIVKTTKMIVSVF